MADSVLGTTGTGGTVAVGVPVTGTIDFGSDQDWYKITLTAGHTYVFELLALDSALGTLNDPVLRLLNGLGAELAFDDDSGIGRESRITFIASATGNYFLSAQGYASEAGTFRLTATDTGSATDVAGGTATSATVTAGVPVTGTIGATGDQDWYRVTLTAGHQYSFDLLGIDTSSSTLNDPFLRLLNGLGAQLATDDDSGVGLESHIAFTATTSGDYYLSAQGVGSGVGTFELEVEDVGLIPADTVAGSTATGATVAVGVPETGTIGAANDQDWYRVTLVAGTQYRFDLQGFDSGQGSLEDPYLRLLSATGVLIASSDDADGTLDSSITYTASASGDYFLSAQGFGSGTGTFTLTATSLGSIPTDAVGNTIGTSVNFDFLAGASVAGVIDAALDQDWYQVTLINGHEYRFELHGVSSGDGTLNDPLLRLLDTTGTAVLAQNDDAGGSLDSSFTFTPDVDGDFFLSAQGFGTGAGTYVLSATDLFGSVPDVASGNGTTATVAFAPVTGTIDVREDQDWYQITLLAGHTYVFDMQGLDSASGTLDDPYLRLIDNAGFEVMSDDDGGAAGRDSNFSFTPALAGTYFVSAQGFGSSTGTFTLDVDDLGLPPDIVPATIATTYSVPIGQSVTGEINTGGDHDWYRVTLQDGHTYRFELLGIGSHQGTLDDPILWLHNAAGDPVAFNDDVNFPANLESSLTFSTPNGGTATDNYYLSAEGYLTNLGTYRLNVLDVSNPVEIPETVSTASTLPIGSFATSNIEVAGDWDWYRITLESGHMYEINLRGAYSGGGTLVDPYLELFNSDSVLELLNDDIVPPGPGANPDSNLQLTAFNAGTFYVSAEGYGTNTGTYTLELDEIDVFAGTTTYATVGVGETITGTIDAAFDQDWFVLSTSGAPVTTRWELLVGQTYRVDLAGAGLPGFELADPYLQLWELDPNTLLPSTLVAFNDDSNGSLNSSLTFTTDPFTTYYISAEGFADGAGTFELSLTQIGGVVIQGDPGVNALFGTPYNDDLYGYEGADILDGKEGSDWIDGGTGNDTLAGGAGDDWVYGWDGNDVFVAANEESAGDDALFGEAGNDEFTDHFGNNEFYGGDGNDVFWLSVEEYGNNLITGGAGEDTYRFLPGLPDVPAGGNPIYVVTDFTVGPGGDRLDVDALIEASTADGYFVEGVSSVADFLRIEQSGTDALVQWDRDGAGSAFDWVTQASLKHVDETKVDSENFAGVVDIGTKSNDLIFGNLGNDNIVGVGGNDTLNGGGGEDTLQGGSGNDFYYVDDAKDVVLETSNTPSASSLVYLPGNPDPILVASAGIEGIIDTVIAAVNFSLANFAFVENLTLSGTAAVATGNALSNALTGNAGNDVLNGSAGNDTMAGGVGNDTMAGGVGNDTYVVNIATDVVTEAAGAGTDRVQSTVSWTLGANLENLTLTGAAVINGIGNSLNNSMTGNTANNILNGGTGNDTMAGGAGNDTYVRNAAGDVVSELAGQGIDTVQSAVSFALGANVEKLTLTGAAAINGTGNTLNNLLTGNTANNVLNGGTGNDTMAGGVGNDTYVRNAAGDVVTELAGQGIDTVQSAVSFTLGANVEKLTLTGAAAINGIGNTLNNVLTGNTANNILNGGTGNDTMAGGAGNDTYVRNAAGDVVSELAGQGIDTVQSAVSFTLGANMEKLTLTGAAAINGIGNTLNNLLTGNTANNILNGGAGADTLNGGNGNDTLVWDALDVNVNGAAGTDTLRVDGATALNLTTVSDTKILNVEVINLAGTNTLTLALADVLAISSSTDILKVDGAAGDTVHRGGGWTQGADQGGYHSYTQGLATLLVDADINSIV